MENIDKEVEYSTQTTKKSYERWSSEMDSVLLKVLKDQQLKGGKEGKKFTDKSYQAIVAAVNTEFVRKMKRNHVQNRLKTLKAHMSITIYLLKKNGFSWNNITKTIEADTKVWEGAIQENEEVKLVRNKELPHLDLMREIYEKDKATGSKAESAKEKKKRWQKEGLRLSIEDIDELQAENAIHLEGFDSFTDSETHFEEILTCSANSMSKQSSIRKRGIKRKALIVDTISERTKDVKDGKEEVAQAMTIGSKSILEVNNGENNVKRLGKKIGLEGDMLCDAMYLIV